MRLIHQVSKSNLLTILLAEQVPHHRSSGNVVMRLALSLLHGYQPSQRLTEKGVACAPGERHLAPIESQPCLEPPLSARTGNAMDHGRQGRSPLADA
jgi:hypothetical protein